MISIWRIVISVMIFQSKSHSCSVKEDSWSNVHHSLANLYQEMSNGNQSTNNVNKVLAIQGRVKSEDPCRVVFQIPLEHDKQNVFKIDLHLKVNSYLKRIEFIYFFTDFRPLQGIQRKRCF